MFTIFPFVSLLFFTIISIKAEKHCCGKESPSADEPSVITEMDKIKLFSKFLGRQIVLGDVNNGFGVQAAGCRMRRNAQHYYDKQATSNQGYYQNNYNSGRMNNGGGYQPQSVYNPPGMGGYNGMNVKRGAKEDFVYQQNSGFQTPSPVYTNNLPKNLNKQPEYHTAKGGEYFNDFNDYAVSVPQKMMESNQHQADNNYRLAMPSYNERPPMVEQYAPMENVMSRRHDLNVDDYHVASMNGKQTIHTTHKSSTHNNHNLSNNQYNQHNTHPHSVQTATMPQHNNFQQDCFNGGCLANNQWNADNCNCFGQPPNNECNPCQDCFNGGCLANNQWNADNCNCFGQPPNNGCNFCNNPPCANQWSPNFNNFCCQNTANFQPTPIAHNPSSPIPAHPSPAHPPEHPDKPDETTYHRGVTVTGGHTNPTVNSSTDKDTKKTNSDSDKAINCLKIGGDTLPIDCKEVGHFTGRILMAPNGMILSVDQLSLPNLYKQETDEHPTKDDKK